MTKWERFGDDTWINVDRVEVVHVEAQDDGQWQLTAAFASGRSYPIGCHADRELLAECTDAVLRGQVGERLGELAEMEATTEVTPQEVAPPEVAPHDVTPERDVNGRTRWWSWRPRRHVGAGGPDLLPEGEPLPAA